MLDTFIDIDSLNSIQEVISSIRMYRLLASNGASFDNISFNTSELEPFYCLFEDYALDTFPSYDVYHVNNPETDFPCIKVFQDVVEYFDYDEVTVVGLVFHGVVEDFYNKCKEANVPVEDTFLTVCIDDFNKGIMQVGDGVSYMELFIPVEEATEETQSPLMMFYTDPSLISYESLCALYDAFNYCRSVVDGTIELKGKG